MKLFPAIDLYDGKVVRLIGGDFAKRTFYAATPLEAAKGFLAEGCDNIHVVDLEGAEKGAPCHLGVLEKIASLGMFTQYGGGLRSIKSLKDAADAGADRVMVGSLLFASPEMPALIASALGRAAMPAVDVRNGRVVCGGWLKETRKLPRETIDELRAAGFSVFLVTDTERDGMMSGARAEMYRELIGDGYEITAAGGITTPADIRALAAAGVSAAVVGKSLYEGGMTLEEALAATGAE